MMMTIDSVTGESLSGVRFEGKYDNVGAYHGILMTALERTTNCSEDELTEMGEYYGVPANRKKIQQRIIYDMLAENLAHHGLGSFETSSDSDMTFIVDSDASDPYDYDDPYSPCMSVIAKLPHNQGTLTINANPDIWKDGYMYATIYGKPLIEKGIIPSRSREPLCIPISMVPEVMTSISDDTYDIERLNAISEIASRSPIPRKLLDDSLNKWETDYT